MTTLDRPTFSLLFSIVFGTVLILVFQRLYQRGIIRIFWFQWLIIINLGIFIETVFKNWNSFKTSFVEFGFSAIKIPVLLTIPFVLVVVFALTEVNVPEKISEAWSEAWREFYKYYKDKGLLEEETEKEKTV